MDNKDFISNKELLKKYADQPDLLGNKPKLNLKKSYSLFQKAKQFIPGGICGARNPNMFIAGEYPVFLERGKGAYVWDVDGNRYLDLLAGFGPTTLGLAMDEIDAAVSERIRSGICFSLSHRLQITLCEKIKKYFPCAENTLLCKTGTDTTVIATRIARAYTGKELILTDGYHGWGDFSQYGTDDGVPDAVKGKTVRIKYGDYKGYEEAVEAGNAAAIMITPYPAAPMKSVETDVNFLEKIRRLCDRKKIPLIFDEIRTAFRFAMGGISEITGVHPDLVCIAKAFANGYSIAALGGKRELMNTLSIGSNPGGTFVSSTYFPNCLEMEAALRTIQFYEDKDVITDIKEKGAYFVRRLQEVAGGINAPVLFEEEPSMPSMMFDPGKMTEEDFYARTLTLYTYMVRSNILIHPFRQMYITYSLTYNNLDYVISSYKKGLELVNSKYGW